jgi:hypothetical protein
MWPDMEYLGKETATYGRRSALKGKGEMMKTIIAAMICMGAMCQIQDTRAGASMSVKHAIVSDDGFIIGEWKENFGFRTMANDHTGEITIMCPGSYTIDADLNITDRYSPSGVHIWLEVNGDRLHGSMRYHWTNGSPETISISTMAQLEPGDTITLRIEMSYGDNETLGILSANVRALRYMMPLDGE